jgi:hypothetical protein
MPADDLDDRLTKIEKAIDRLERAVVTTKRERDPLDELAEHAQKIVGAFDDMRAQAQEGTQESGFHTVLGAIRDNTAATNSLLATSDARLQQIELELADPDDLFAADAQVLAEGEFLKQQLTGLEGTEGRAPKFKDAPKPQTPSGLQVLADAVDDLTPDDGVS